jgi:hypothetical protein
MQVKKRTIKIILAIVIFVLISSLAVSALIQQNKTNADKIKIEYSVDNIKYTSLPNTTVKSQSISRGGVSYNYAVTQSPVYKAYFRTNSNTAKPVRYEKDGYFFIYDVSGSALEWVEQTGFPSRTNTLGGGVPSNSQNSVIIVDTDNIIYKGAFSNTDIKYQLDSEMMKETFILSGLPSIKPYNYLRYTGHIYFNASLQICANDKCYKPKGTEDNFETQGKIYFKDLNNKTIFYLEEPLIKDAKGSKVLGKYVVRGSNAQMVFELRIPTDFIRNATFPIYIDPTVVSSVEKYISFSPSANISSDCILKKKINGNWENINFDIFYNYSYSKWKFGAIDNSNSGWEQYKYIVTSKSQIMKKGQNTFGIDEYILNFNDICNGKLYNITYYWKNSTKIMNKTILDTANCSYVLWNNSQLYYVEVTFKSKKFIDPSFGYNQIGHWKLDETSGTTVSTSVGSYNGESTADISGYTTTGKLNGAFNFPDGFHVNISDGNPFSCNDNPSLDCSSMNEATCNTYSAGCQANNAFSSCYATTYCDTWDGQTVSNCQTNSGNTCTMDYDFGDCYDALPCSSQNENDCTTTYDAQCDASYTFTSCSTTGSCGSFSEGNCPTSYGCSEITAVDGVFGLQNPSSLVFWIKTTSSGDNPKIFTKLTGSIQPTNGWYFKTDGTNVKLGGFSGTELVLGNFTQIADGNWHFIVITVNDSVNYYVDNVIQSSQGYSSLPNIFGQPFRIGDSEEAGGNQWNGTLDDVRYYQEAINQSLINALWNGGVGNDSDGEYSEPADTTPPYFTTIPPTKVINYTQGFLVQFVGTDAVGFGTYAINWTDFFSINSTGHLTNSSPNLPVGVYYINVTINDTSNNLNSTIWELDINKATPILTFLLNGGTLNLTLEYPAYVNVSATSNFGTVGLDKNEVDYLINNSLNLSLPLGSYLFRANITGNENYSDVSYSYYNVTVVDTTKPLIDFVYPTLNGNYINLNNLTINITASDLNLANITIRLYNQTELLYTNISTSSPFNIIYLNLPDGIYFFNATATDTSSNVNNTQTRNATIDTISPNATLLSPANGKYWNTDQNLTANLTDNIGLINATLYIQNTSDNSIITHLFTFTEGITNAVVGWVQNLSDGIYKWWYSVFDRAGNQYTTENRTFTIDKTSPKFYNLTENPSNPSTYSLGASYEFNSTWIDTNIGSVKIEFNGINYTATANGNLFNFSIKDLIPGTYNYYWWANDSAGNVNQTSIQTYTIDKIQGNISTFLNNSRNNITITQSDAIYLNSTLNSGIGSINLYKDGSLINSGSSSLSNLTNFTSAGTYNITSFYAGNENYTSASETFFVIVNSPPSPPSGGGSGSTPPQNLNIPKNPKNIEVDYQREWYRGKESTIKVYTYNILDTLYYPKNITISSNYSDLFITDFNKTNYAEIIFKVNSDAEISSRTINILVEDEKNITKTIVIDITKSPEEIKTELQQTQEKSTRKWIIIGFSALGIIFVLGISLVIDIIRKRKKREYAELF